MEPSNAWQHPYVSVFNLKPKPEQKQEGDVQQIMVCDVYPFCEVLNILEIGQTDWETCVSHQGLNCSEQLPSNPCKVNRYKHQRINF